MAPARSVRVLVFAAGEAERIAREAGADYVGADDLVAADPGRLARVRRRHRDGRQMGKVGGLGRILGRRGLMPNPRSGTVVRNAEDLPGVIRELKGGRVEFRNDRTGIVHFGDRAQELRRRRRFATTCTPSSMRCSGRSRLAPRASTCVHLTLTSTMAPGIAAQRPANRRRTRRRLPPRRAPLTRADSDNRIDLAEDRRCGPPLNLRPRPRDDATAWLDACSAPWAHRAQGVFVVCLIEWRLARDGFRGNRKEVNNACQLPQKAAIDR